MDNIKQLENNKKIAIVWYGVCGEDCADYDLKASENQAEINKLDHIYEISDNETKPIYYSSYASVHNFEQSLEQLQCGHAYYLVLKKGNDTLNIPNITYAHEGIENAGKISQTCILAPEIVFSDLVAVEPADLRLQLTVDITDLIAPCAANTWKYKVIRVSTGEEVGIFDGNNTTNPAVVKTTKMPAGGEEYKVSIWGVNSAGERITDEPDQEKTVTLPFPSSGLNINGAVNVQYLEFQGPANSADITFSGDVTLIEKILLVKPSMNEDDPKSDEGITNWMYSIYSDDSWSEYVEYASISENGIELDVLPEKIKWRLKSDLSAGDASTAFTEYNSLMVIKYTGKDGVVQYAEKVLNGKVLNRAISISSFTDTRNMKARVNVNLTNATRWKYKLELVESDSSHKLVIDFDDVGFIQDSFTNIDITDIIKDTFSNVDGLGPATYRVTVQTYHDTDDGIIVAPTDSAEQSLNYPKPILNATPSISDTYVEESGPNATGQQVKLLQYDYVNLQTIKFSGSDTSIWEYKKNESTSWTSLSSSEISVATTDTFEFRIIAGVTKSTTSESLVWTATGLSGESATFTTTLNATITEAVVLPGVLWFSFGGTTTLNAYKTTDWIQANTFEQVKVYADNTWPLSGFAAAVCKEVSETQIVDMNPAVSTPTHNVANNTPFSKAEDFGPLDTTNLLHGKTISSDTTGFYVSVDLPYTKIEIKDQNTFARALAEFKSESDADEMFSVALASSSDEPSKVTTELFSSDDIDMSCKDCDDLDSLSSVPYIFVKIEGTSTPFQYKAKILNCENDSGWQKAESPWNGSRVVYTCSSPKAPVLSDSPIIEEIYFASDFEGETKLKLVDFSC